MSDDAAMISPAQVLTATVPLVRTLGLEFDRTTAQEAVVRLPDQPALHNHLGGPHAGAIFSLAETASGALLLACFGDQLGRAVPLAVEARIRYLKLARGEVTATARLSGSRDEVVAELEAGGRPEFTVDVEVARADGDVTAQVSVVWTLRPNS